MIEGCSIHIELSSVYLKFPVLLRLPINQQTMNNNKSIFKESNSYLQEFQRRKRLNITQECIFASNSEAALNSRNAGIFTQSSWVCDYYLIYILAFNSSFQ